jgi:hypothetical protein
MAIDLFIGFLLVQYEKKIAIGKEYQSQVRRRIKGTINGIKNFEIRI